MRKRSWLPPGQGRDDVQKTREQLGVAHTETAPPEGSGVVWGGSARARAHAHTRTSASHGDTAGSDAQTDKCGFSLSSWKSEKT